MIYEQIIMINKQKMNKIAIILFEFKQNYDLIQQIK